MTHVHGGDQMKTGYETPNDRYENVNKRYEEKTAPVPAEKESNGPHTINGILCNAHKVRIRRAPSMSAAELVILPEGSSVEVLSDTQVTFYKVKTSSGQIGYVHKDFCKVSKGE